jgi:hypothetical protein
MMGSPEYGFFLTDDRIMNVSPFKRDYFQMKACRFVQGPASRYVGGKRGEKPVARDAAH